MQLLNMCMRIQIVTDDNYVVNSINLDRYELDDPDDVQRLVDYVLDIINEFDDEE